MGAKAGVDGAGEEGGVSTPDPEGFRVAMLIVYDSWGRMLAGTALFWQCNLEGIDLRLLEVLLDRLRAYR